MQERPTHVLAYRQDANADGNKGVVKPGAGPHTFQVLEDDGGAFDGDVLIYSSIKEEPDMDVADDWVYRGTIAGAGTDKRLNDDGQAYYIEIQNRTTGAPTVLMR